MKYIYTFLIGLIFSVQSVMAQKAISLFNQKDLKGWYAFEPETGKHAIATELFSVENSMIRMYGKKAGYLMSERTFNDFRLTVEFRWNMDTTFARKGNTKNSGVMYLVPADTADMLWPQGIQFQIKDGATGDFVFLQKVTALVNGQRTEPGKSVVAKRILDGSNPDGEWNIMVVTVEKGKIKQELNGKLVNEGSEPSVSQGHILLQYEGFPVDFRKVEVKEIR